MKQILFLLLVTITFSACIKPNCCTMMDLGVVVKYVDSDGNNLFDNDSNSLTLSDIVLYHKIDGEWKEYYESNLTNARGLQTSQREDGLYIDIFTSITYVEGNISESKIEIKGYPTDIIKTEVDKQSNGIFVTKVWYNDELKWDAASDKTSRRFTITKTK